jgi:hypothetical protein
MTFIAILIFMCRIQSSRERERERGAAAQCDTVMNLQTANATIDMCLNVKISFIQSYYATDKLNCVVQRGLVHKEKETFLILTIFNLSISMSVLSRV